MHIHLVPEFPFGCLCRAINDRYGVEISVDPYLACDINVSCQEHIKNLGEVSVLFGDVKDVAAGKGKNLLNGEEPWLGTVKT